MPQSVWFNGLLHPAGANWRQALISGLQPEMQNLQVISISVTFGCCSHKCSPLGGQNGTTKQTYEVLPDRGIFGLLVGASWRQDFINRLQPEMQYPQVCFVTEFITYIVLGGDTSVEIQNPSSRSRLGTTATA